MSRGAPAVRLLLTCEHAGAEVPPRWRPLFRDSAALLASHRGHDAGAWSLARRLARALSAPLVGHHLTRLLVDANRSPGHPAFFSELTRELPRAERRRLVATCWAPHRHRVESRVATLLEGGATVLHVGVHSFTPVLRGEVRRADVGLLYDPSRVGEAAFCAAWKAALLEVAPELRVRRNYPYRGVSDGLTTALRRGLPPDRYLGIELEVNQAALAGSARGRVHAAVEAALGAVLARDPRRRPAPPSPPRPRGEA